MTKLEDSLNLTPTVIEMDDPEILLEPINEQRNNDIAETRKRLKELVNKGTDMVETLMGIANTTGTARSFEVLNQFMRTLMDLNESVVELHIKETKLPDAGGGNVGGKGGNVTNNNLFVGSTVELQRMLADLKNGKTGLDE